MPSNHEQSDHAGRVLALGLAGLLGLTWGGGVFAGQQPERALDEEIPLERCHRLPVAVVRVESKEKRFLVDTAATSMLNLASFASAVSKGSKKVQVTSYSGSKALSAREVVLQEFALGSHRLRDVELPAIDLSPIGDACGGRIDGILGVDLLEKMGATIDLKRRVALLERKPGEKEKENGKELAAFNAFHRSCVEALNRGSGEVLEACFDPDIALFTPWGEFHGRGEVMDYLRRRYLHHSPLPQFTFYDRDIHLLGEFAWFGYDYTIRMPEDLLRARGTVTFRKRNGRWQIVLMHNSMVSPQSPPESDFR